MGELRCVGEVSEGVRALSESVAASERVRGEVSACVDDCVIRHLRKRRSRYAI